jgi:hypothetical protein
VLWAGAVVIDLLTDRWRSGLDPREQAVSYSVLPLAKQVTKLLIFLFAILSVLSIWDTTHPRFWPGLE